MASSFKRKKRSLPKYWGGGSIYSDASANASSNAKYSTYTGFADDPNMQEQDLSLYTGKSADTSLLSSNTLPLTSGSEFKTSGDAATAGTAVANPEIAKAAGAGDAMGGMGGGMGGGWFAAIEAGAKGLTNQENAKYTDGAQGDMSSNLEKQAGKILPWMGMATALRDMGQSYLGRDELGNVKGGGNKAANEWMTADHTHMLKYAQKGDAWGTLRESAGWGKIGRSVSHIAGKGKEDSGGWGKFNRAMGMEKDKEAVDPNLAFKQQAEMADIANKNKYGTFRQGGRIYNSGNGIPNAEIEKQEVTSYTQGGVEAHDLNTHENATPDNQISLQRGDMILSDKIKDPLNGNKTFAKVGKPYDTKKEEKILNDIKASNLSKKTAELNFMSKKTLFQQTFERQEQLKADKVRKYASKLGVDLNPGQANLGIMPEFAYGGIQQYDEGGYSQWRSIREKEGWVVDPRNASNAQYPSMYNPKAMSIVQDTAHGSGWNIAPAKGVTDATDAYGFPNPNYYGSYNVPKQVIGTGQFKTGYTPAPGGGGYIKIGDTSTIPTHKFINGTYQPIQTNRYGGIQKFGNAGMFDDEEPSLGYTPKTLAEKYKMQQASLSKPKASIYNQETDPNGGSENWSDFNSPEFKKENQEMLARAQEAAKSEQSPKGSNWKEGVYQGVTGLASNMGEIYAMYKASKPVEVQQRYDYKPEVLNNTAADRAAWRMYKNTAESLKNAGLSGGQYASNLGANRASLTEQLDTQRINRENVNVGIRNDAQRTNIAGRYSVDDINARNRAAKENLQLKATERMGTNFAQQSKDYRATQQEKQMLPFMQKAFSDPAFQKMFAEWMASNGGKTT